MSAHAAITVQRSREEVERLWNSPQDALPHIGGSDAVVRFVNAPGDRGTEIHVETAPSGKLGETVQKLVGSGPLAKVKDDLRRFKQLVETGEVARSEGSPEGERAERMFKQRPAQPLADDELEKAAVR